jgi:outer membrane immunogenic protein
MTYPHLWEEMPMRKLFLAGLAVSALVMPALAADMPPFYREPPPPLLPPPVLGWTGLYIGANAGWIGSSDDTFANTGPGVLGAALAAGIIQGTIGVSYSGFMGGGQIGYNWQVWPNWVLGVETDFDGVSARGTATLAFPGGGGFVPFSGVFSRELDTLGTLRGKVGYLSAVNLLWYATGGLAYGETKISAGWSCPTCVPPAGVGPLGSSNMSVGWTVGAGVEWKFTPRWSVRAEYLYVDLGSQSNAISTVNERDNIVRAGINYQFF